MIITTIRLIAGIESRETRFYLSSHRPRAKLLAQVIRKHWANENSQHWILNVAFDEDAQRQQDRNGAANLSAVRRLALRLLRQHKTNKRGIKSKRLNCALDPNYLLQVLANAKI